MATAIRDQQLRSASHGRGGAGNFNSRPSDAGVTSQDLRTPMIKESTYTTGRGGSGNMVSNDDPSAARVAQDVESPAAVQKDPQGTFHWGRGGEGNKVTLGGADRPKQNERKGSKGAGERRPSFAGVIEKGKEMLGVGKKKEGLKGDESAVVEDRLE